MLGLMMYPAGLRVCSYLCVPHWYFQREKLKAYNAWRLTIITYGTYNYCIRCQLLLIPLLLNTSGWVRTVYFYDIGNENCILMAKVTPSQWLCDRPHEAWVAVNKATCAIVTGHCTCMVGYVNKLCIQRTEYYVLYYQIQPWRSLLSCCWCAF